MILNVMETLRIIGLYLLTFVVGGAAFLGAGFLLLNMFTRQEDWNGPGLLILIILVVLIGLVALVAGGLAVLVLAATRHELLPASIGLVLGYAALWAINHYVRFRS